MNAEPALDRALGPWGLAAIIVDIVVGAGILGLPSKLFALVGAYCIPGWILSAALMGLVAACFAEVGSRDVPFALAVGLSFLALLYLLIQLVCVGVTPDLAVSQRPLVDAAQRVLGHWGGVAVNVGALVTMLGTLFAIILTGSRLPFALAEREQLPPFFRRVHPRFRTPYVAIIITAVCSAAFTLSTSFLGPLGISVLTRLVGYAATCIALVVMRRRVDVAPAGFNVPAGNVVAVIALVGCAWLMLAISPAELLSVALILGLGVALSVSHLWRRRYALTHGG